jgi:hypothetical protein
MGEALRALMHDALSYLGPELLLTLFALIAGVVLLLMARPFSSKRSDD